MLTVRETRLVLDLAKEIRLYLEHQLALARFHLHPDELQPYQRRTVQLMATALIRILEQEDTGCSLLRKKKFLSHIHARIVQRLLQENMQSTMPPFM